jgi:hypothetical protein
MSHVDDGTLHAYLDGELTAVEVDRLTAHLAGCQACRTRLEEERALVERASRLLDLAAPPASGRVVPPLAELRRPRRWWQVRTPLAWAATVVLAVGLGWMMRPLGRPARDELAPVAALDRSSRPLAVASEQARDRADTRQSAGNAAGPAARLEPRRTPAPTVDVAQAEPRASLEVSNSLAVNKSVAQPTMRGYADVPSAVVMHTITLEQARRALGVDPASIPGYPIRGLSRSPSDSFAVVVEQDVEGTQVQLFERQAPAAYYQLAPGAVERHRDAASGAVAAPAAPALAKSERLARYIRGLRIEIAGPLMTDSLNKLLEQIR